MKDSHIQKLIDMNYRTITLLGMATSIINSNKIDQSTIDWFMSAINNVIYLNNPIPEKEKK